MSFYDYQESIRIAGMDFDFYALIMAAMRKADTGNLDALKRAFPLVYDELIARYSAPGGCIGSELTEDLEQISRHV